MPPAGEKTEKPGVPAGDAREWERDVGPEDDFYSSTPPFSSASIRVARRMKSS